MTAKLATVDDRILAGAEAADAMGGSVVRRNPSDKPQGCFMQFDSGYLSPYFVTDPERMEVAFENPYILIHEKQISSKQDLLPLRRGCLRRGAGYSRREESEWAAASCRRQGARLMGSAQEYVAGHCHPYRG